MQLAAPLLVLASLGLLLRAFAIGRRPGGVLPYRRAERAALWLAFWLALIPPLFLLIAPTGSVLSRTESTGADSASTTILRVRLLEVVRPWEALFLALPIVLVAAVLLARTSSERRSVMLMAAALLTLFVVLGAMTIGVIFVPSMVALWLAVLLAPRRPRTS